MTSLSLWKKIWDFLIMQNRECWKLSRGFLTFYAFETVSSCQWNLSCWHSGGERWFLSDADTESMSPLYLSIVKQLFLCRLLIFLKPKDILPEEKRHFFIKGALFCSLLGSYQYVVSLLCLHALMFTKLFISLILPVLQHLFSPSVWNQSPVCSDWLAGRLCCDS